MRGCRGKQTSFRQCRFCLLTEVFFCDRVLKVNVIALNKSAIFLFYDLGTRRILQKNELTKILKSMSVQIIKNQHLGDTMFN